MATEHSSRTLWTLFRLRLQPRRLQLLDRDGNLDLVVIDEVGNPSVLIYLAKGDGTFSAGATYMTGTSFTNTVQAADFNGDGKVDITVGTESGSISSPAMVTAHFSRSSRLRRSPASPGVS